MRTALALASIAAITAGIALAQTPPARAPAPSATPAGKAAAPAPGGTPATAAAKGAAQPAPANAAAAPLPAPAVQPPPTCAENPNALPVSRVVEIDTTGGPGFGFEHFKEHDFLKMNEIVLTFDDGPWPRNTPAVLDALAAHCLKATFFPIGKHAMWHPEILKQVAAAGHTIGSHTWSHADLSKKSAAEAKDEIEKGLSAVHLALGGAASAPFFRFPALRHPPEMVTYLGQRNIAIFSTDIDSFDFKLRKPEQVIASVLAKLKKHGKGIILLHDFQHPTADALPELLKQLKDNGYKVVIVKAKGTAQSLAEYDEQVGKEIKLPTLSNRPTSSVVRTISGESN